MRHRGPVHRLPAGPFRAWLQTELGYSHNSTSELARRVDRDEAQVRRWLCGAHPTVELNTVDHCFTRAGDPGALSLLYPTGDR